MKAPKKTVILFGEHQIVTWTSH